MAVPYVLITDTFTTHVNRTNLLIDAVEGALSNTSNSVAATTAAFNQANTAYGQANAAYVRANTVGGAAFGQANAAYDRANTVGAAAFDQANTAYGQANTGYNQANAAYGQGNTAYTIAVAAFGAANSVGGVAEAFNQANTAYGQANTAYNQANAAYARANSVGGAVTTANNTAIAAFAKANASFQNTGGTLTGPVNFNNTATFNAAVTFNSTIDLQDRYSIVATETPNTINCMIGNYFTRNITNNQTITFINPPNTGNAYSMILRLANAGSFTITWANAPKWPGGVAPTFTGGYGNTDILVFITENGGGLWRGVLSQKDSR